VQLQDVSFAALLMRSQLYSSLQAKDHIQKWFLDNLDEHGHFWPLMSIGPGCCQ